MWHALLRLCFRLLYNELAWSYDLVAWLVSLGQWKAWGRTALPYFRGKRVLELGHGPGHLLLSLEARGLEPVGIDLSHHMTRLAKRRLRRSDGDAPLVRARAQMLPFRKGAFDSVVATFPTSFIAQSPTMCEAKRVLAPSGHLIVVSTARFEAENLVSRFLAWLYRVTGQSQPIADSFIPWLEQLGFSSHVVWEEVDRTAVLLVVAQRH